MNLLYQAPDKTIFETEKGCQEYEMKLEKLLEGKYKPKDNINFNNIIYRIVRFYKSLTFDNPESRNFKDYFFVSQFMYICEEILPEKAMDEIRRELARRKI